VAEKGEWSEKHISAAQAFLMRAQTVNDPKDIHRALIEYTHLAMIGVEVAQYNAGYLLQMLSSSIDFPRISPNKTTNNSLQSITVNESNNPNFSPSVGFSVPLAIDLNQFDGEEMKKVFSESPPVSAVYGNRVADELRTENTLKDEYQIRAIMLYGLSASNGK